jgi:hypothetical protein
MAELTDLISTYFSRQEVIGGEKSQKVFKTETQKNRELLQKSLVGALRKVRERIDILNGFAERSLNEDRDSWMRNEIITQNMVKLQQEVLEELRTQRSIEASNKLGFIPPVIFDEQKNIMDKMEEQLGILNKTNNETSDEMKDNVEETIESRKSLSQYLDSIRNFFYRKETSDLEDKRERQRAEERDRGFFTKLLLGEKEKVDKSKGLFSGLFAAGGILGLMGKFLKFFMKGGLFFAIFASIAKLSDDPEFKKTLEDLGTALGNLAVQLKAIVVALAPIAAEIFTSLIQNLSLAITDLSGGFTKILEGDILGGLKQIFVGEDGNGGLFNAFAKFVTDGINALFGTDFKWEGLTKILNDLELAITEWVYKNIPEELRGLLGIRSQGEQAKANFETAQQEAEDAKTESSKAENLFLREMDKFMRNRYTESERLAMSQEQQIETFMRASESGTLKTPVVEIIDRHLNAIEANMEAQKKLLEAQNKLNQVMEQTGGLEFDVTNPLERVAAEGRLMELRKDIEKAEMDNQSGIGSIPLDVLREERDALYRALNPTPNISATPDQQSGIIAEKISVAMNRALGRGLGSGQPVAIQADTFNSPQTNMYAPVTVHPASATRGARSPQSRDVYGDPQVLVW